MPEHPRNLPQPLSPAMAAAEIDADGASSLLATRAYREVDHPYRLPFTRDIGRILHAKSFRRLAGKTQVFTRRGAESDHSRSRLTHTLEVAQIARTAAATLGLNASLAEALALVHDLGHPPYGHEGEKALDDAMRRHGLRFDHNLHALRIVTSFEERSPAFPGLNLTLAVREGIVKHSRDYPPTEYPELTDYFLDQFPPLEAQLIDLADEIAYLTADLEDGLGAGVLELGKVRDEVPFFAANFAQVQRAFPAAEPPLLANEALKRMLNALATDLIWHTAQRVRESGIETLSEVRCAASRLAGLSPEMEEQRLATKRYLYAHLYQSRELEPEHTRAAQIVHGLFSAWTGDPGLLPEDYQARVAKEGVVRAVADYIAGMTDLFIEQAWNRHGKPTR